MPLGCKTWGWRWDAFQRLFCHSNGLGYRTTRSTDLHTHVKRRVPGVPDHPTVTPRSDEEIERAAAVGPSALCCPVWSCLDLNAVTEEGMLRAVCGPSLRGG